MVWSKIGAFALLLFLISFLLTGCREGGVTEPLSVASTTPTPPPLIDEGWESSGGSGVACFASEMEAKQADAVLARQGSLDDEMRRKIVTLVTLDRWEYEGRMHYTAATPLDIVEGRFRRHTPIFATRLNLLKKRIDLSSWKEDLSLPKVDDVNLATPVENVDPKCRLIQLAVRKSKSVPGQLPAVFVVFDKWLFENRLGQLDRDMLKLHEWLYLVGRETKHRDSDVIRKMVAYYFSDEFANSLFRRVDEERRLLAAGRVKVGVNYPGRLVSDPIYDSFGDYYRFFVLDPLDRPSEVPTQVGQYSRYVSFGRLLTLLRERMLDCLTKKGFTENDPVSVAMLKAKGDCSEQTIDGKELEPLLDPEQSFLFLADFALTYTRAVETFEHLVIWDRADPKAIDAFQKNQLGLACLGLEVIETNAYNPPFDLTNFQPVVPRAQMYCRQLGLPLR